MSLESHFIASLFEGVFIFDARARLLRVNTAGERILGRSEKAVAGETADGLFPVNPELAELVRASLGESRALVHSGIEYAGQGGRPFHLSVSVSPIQEPDGTLIGATLIVRDETLLKEIDRSQRRADQLATMGIMNLGMAHEIKNPLGGIKGAAQLLRSDLEEDSPLIEYSDVILREVDRIDRLLEGLLAAQPRGEVHFEELNIHEVLNEVLRLLELSGETSNLTFSRVFDPSLPAIRGDRNGLTQVFLNLLKNAVEASPPGGEVTVRTLVPVGMPRGQMPAPRARQKGGVLEVDVMDRGQGFDPSAGDFPAPFFTTKTKGVGLGLAITEQIIRNHEGALHLENREEGGAVVKVFLPLGSVKDEG
jgi:two-component system nitrogen regulation sensor histidine kinase GlnL